MFLDITPVHIVFDSLQGDTGIQGIQGVKGAQVPHFIFSAFDYTCFTTCALLIPALSLLQGGKGSKGPKGKVSWDC